MSEILNGILKAIELIVSLDPEVISIAGRSLSISATSVIIAALLFIPLGSIIHFHDFRGKRALVNLIQTLYSVPTVAIGLFVFLFFSNAGPLGSLGIMFTPTLMVIAQVVLISPILTGLTITALSGVDSIIKDTALSLGASDFQASIVILKEARYAVVAAIIMSFGRAISELGCAMMVGGNIRGFTRVLTTAISLETQKGEMELSIALGIILVFLALTVNLILNRVQQR